MRDYIFPKLRSSTSQAKLFKLKIGNINNIKDDEHIEIEEDYYSLKCCLKQFLPAKMDIELLKKDMARYKSFSFVGILKDVNLQKESISNLHFNEKFTSILFYSVDISYNEILPETISDNFGRKLILNKSSKNYILNGNIEAINLTATAVYELASTPQKLPVHVLPPPVAGGVKKSLKFDT